MQQNEEPVGFDQSYRVPHVQQAVVCPLEYRRKALQGVFYVTKNNFCQWKDSLCKDSLCTDIHIQVYLYTRTNVQNNFDL